MPAKCWAAIHDYESLVRLLLEKVFSTAVETGDRVSPLFLAVQNNSKRTVRLLLGHGANMEAGDCTEGTSLLRAAYASSDNLFELLEGSAEVDSRDHLQETSLLKFSRSYSSDPHNLSRPLLKRGADVNAQAGGHGEILLRRALARSSHATVKVLREYRGIALP